MPFAFWTNLQNLQRLVAERHVVTSATSCLLSLRQASRLHDTAPPAVLSAADRSSMFHQIASPHASAA